MQPALWLMGSANNVGFLMSELSDGSVLLPQNAVGGPEILDEPGVAGTAYNSAVALGSKLTTVASNSIAVPGPGYVLVLASFQLQGYHSQGATTDADVGVSDSDAALPSNQDVRFEIDSDIPTGYYRRPGTVHGLFEVETVGTYTYYLLGEEYSGSVTVYDTQFSLLYFPTAYGAVTPTMAASGPRAPERREGDRDGLTQAEIAAERERSRAANLARLERELAEIKAQVDAMKEES
jgi:hypothetical protein